MIREFSEAEIMTFMIRLMVIFLILPLHEFAHAWAAYKCGDDTAKINGRLTLSPFAHMDIFGTLLMLFTGFGWAKPVPVNSSRMRHPRRNLMLTALAGPLVNLLMAFLGVVGTHVAWFFMKENVEALSQILYIFSLININLFVFNMLPVPPLDGSKILIYLLPKRAAVWLIQHQRGFYYIVLIMMATGILSIPLSMISYGILTGMNQLMFWLMPMV